MAKVYDLIGDIHGCYQPLCSLLGELGYQCIDEVWQHSNRVAVFVGDILDRGPQIRECYWLVRKMVDGGHGYMVLGNHEINAIAMNTRVTLQGEFSYVRPRSERHLRQTEQTYRQFEDYPSEWYQAVEWFTQQPLFLELHDFRVVHACWDQPSINHFNEQYQGDVLALIADSANPVSKARQVIDRLTRGTDMRLPYEQTMTSEDGYVRSFFRTKFWVDNADTYGDVQFQPDPLPTQIAETPISEDNRQRLAYYSPSQPLLFVGHYWLRGTPKPLSSNIVCLDYSAVKQGCLVAYSHIVGEPLSTANFLAIGTMQE